jgi:hypothetical protein
MSDLSALQSAGTTKIIGSTSNGVETDPIGATSHSLNTHLKDSIGNTLGTEDNPVYVKASTVALSAFPSFKTVFRRVVPAGMSASFTQNVVNRTAMREFIFGGRGLGEGILAKYFDSQTVFIPNGTFNSAAEVNTWLISGPAPDRLTRSYSTLQFVEGTGSMRWDYTRSDGSNFPETTYTYPTPLDASNWRFISGWFYHVPVSNRVRTVSITLNSGNARRLYSILMNSGDAAGWRRILLEVERPSSEIGTGFDLQSIDSVSVRFVDSGNEAGIFYWDDIKLMGKIDILQKIYTPQQTIRLAFDPVEVFEAGETVLFIMRNNDTTAREFQITAGGVDI